MLCRHLGFILVFALVAASPTLAGSYGPSQTQASIGGSSNSHRSNIVYPLRRVTYEGDLRRARHPAARREGIAYISQVRPRSLYVRKRRSWENFVNAVLMEAEQRKAASDTYESFWIPTVPGVPGVSILFPDRTSLRSYGIEQRFAASTGWPDRGKGHGSGALRSTLGQRANSPIGPTIKTY